jgi:hypothetical protein
MHCGYCKNEGHNRSGCSELKAAIIRENNMDENEEHADLSILQERIVNIQAQDVEQTAGKPQAIQEEAKNTSARGRKRKQSCKMREHVEQLMEKARRKKSKQVIDENGDIDFPIIRTVSIPQFVNLYFSFRPQPLSN